MNIPLEPFLNFNTFMAASPALLFMGGELFVNSRSRTILSSCKCSHLPVCPMPDEYERKWSMNWNERLLRAAMCRHLGCKHHSACPQVQHISQYVQPPLHPDCLYHGSVPEDWEYDINEQEFRSREGRVVKAALRRNPEFERLAYYPAGKSAKAVKGFRRLNQADAVDEAETAPASPRRGRPPKVRIEV